VPALTLHYHPLSSCCHKVLIAIDALGIALDKRQLDLGDPAQRAAYLALWPLGKMPLLVDEGRPIPETSIIIEHLQRHPDCAGRTLIPPDAHAALEVRLWDRLFDLYVMSRCRRSRPTSCARRAIATHVPWPRRAKPCPRPTRSSTNDWTGERGWPAMRSAWPIAPPRRPCFTP
jgi:glutathione S-transferase